MSLNSRPALSACLLGVALLAAALPMAAQNITGSIHGTVTDPSGAVVPGASVIVTDRSTAKVARTVKTDRHGEFQADQLPVGEYDLQIALHGFRSESIEDVILNVGDTATENVSLKPGEASETVTVSANENNVNLQGPEDSTVINQTQIQELALNSRNFEQLLLLQPGVSYTGPDEISNGLVDATGNRNSHNLSVNGLQPTQLSFNFDGADVLDHESIAQAAIFPAVESIEHIKILRDSYGAEYGGGGAAQVLLVSKAGGSSYHGDVFFFFRIPALNANNFFNLIATPPIPRPNNSYYEYGGIFGGPFFIPKIYPRSKSSTFFFVSLTGRTITTTPNAQQGNYPYLAQANGYFADPVCVNGPAVASTSSNKCGTPDSPMVTNSPYAGFNYFVDPATWNPVGAEYVKDIILPTLAITQPNSPSTISQAIISVPATTKSFQTLVRVDQKINSRLSLFARFVYDPYNQVAPGGYNQSQEFPGVNTSQIYNFGRNYLGHGTFVLSPKIVVDFGASYLSYQISATPIGTATAAKSPDIHVNLPFPNQTTRVPAISINGGVWGTDGPLKDLNRTTQFFGNFTTQLGRHTVQYGLNYEHFNSRTNPGDLNAGQFTFGQSGRPSQGGTTAFEEAFADLLEGKINSFTQSSVDPTARISQNVEEAYLQDDWRAMARLTLDLGVRYTLYRQPYDRGGNLGAFQPQSYNPTLAPTFGTDGSLCLGNPANTACAGVAPNPGYAALNGIVRGGINSPFGGSINRTRYNNFAPRVGFAWNVYGDGRTALRGGFGIFYDQVALSIPQAEVNQNPAYVQTYTYGSASAGSTASGTIDFMNPGAQGLIAPQPSDTSGNQKNWTTPYTEAYSLGIQQELMASWIFQIGYVGNKTIHLQGVEDVNEILPCQVGCASALQTAQATQVFNVDRPYQGFESVNLYDTRFYANYNGLQVSTIKSFSKLRGAHISGSYTWSKALANSQGFTIGPQNTYNLKAEYGPTNSDRRNIFNASFVYQLPYLRDSHSLKGDFLGNWEVSGIIQAVSGLWLTADHTDRDAGRQLVLGGNSVAKTNLRPDQLSNPTIGAPHTLAQWFNPADFSLTTANGPGNAPVGSILGPGYQVWNLSLIKNVDLPESLRLQLRAEGFNAFNHVNFSTVSTNAPEAGFGSVKSARDNRQIQLGIKLYF